MYAGWFWAESGGIPPDLFDLHQRSFVHWAFLALIYRHWRNDKEQKLKRLKFVIYRIIGNTLPPRHGPGDTCNNLKFVLENEPDLPSCEKRWVLNRLFDPGA
jgi:hypothetical protein